MLQKSQSRASLVSLKQKSTKPNRQDSLQLCAGVQDTLQGAARTLSHIEFAPIFQKMIKLLIAKAEGEGANYQSVCLQAIKHCLSLYGGSLQLNVRTLLLEILSNLTSKSSSDVTVKLTKAKHLVLQTQIQYLLSKIFLLEHKYHMMVGDSRSALKSIKKCIELNEQHMVQFMQEEETIRKEIVDYAIVAYYEYFSIIKEEKPVVGLDCLLKACNAAKKNYSSESKVIGGLREMYRKEQNILNSMDKVSAKSRAITDILEYDNKRNYKTVAFYSWQDERIVVQLIRTKNKERQIISQASLDIQLDIHKIRMIKSSEWIIFQREGSIAINEEELMRLLGQRSEKNQRQMTTGLELRSLSRDKVIKKNFLSSSEGDEQFFQKQELNILKFPKAQSSRRFKQTQ